MSPESKVAHLISKLKSAYAKSTGLMLIRNIKEEDTTYSVGYTLDHVFVGYVLDHILEDRDVTPLLDDNYLGIYHEALKVILQYLELSGACYVDYLSCGSSKAAVLNNDIVRYLKTL